MQISLPQDGGRKFAAAGVSATRPVITRDVLGACCALAAFCLFQVWFCFLGIGNAGRFYYQGASSVMQFAALLADTVLLTGFFAVVWNLGREMHRFPGGELAGDVAFLLFLVIPGNAIRCVLQPVTAKFNLEYWRHASVQSFAPVLGVSVSAGLVLFLAAVVYFHRPLARIAYHLLVLLFPFVPCMVVEASWILAHPPPGMSQERHIAGNMDNAPLTAGQAGSHYCRRVLWILFDEMDYRLAFESATNARLPEFNQLARQSLHALRAYPPGGRTMISIPALLSGRMVTSSEAAGPSDLLVRYAGDSHAVRWSTDQTIFDVQREYGWRAGVAGWYIPYARIFSKDIDAWQDQAWRLGLNPNQPFAGLMTDQFRVITEGKSQSLLGKSLTVAEHQRVVREVVAAGIRKAVNPRLDLVFLHLPVPHAPFYYDARTGQESQRPRPVIGYLDHLQLGDHVLGQIRRALTKSGLADRTTLVVSSDHWNREGDLLDGRIDHRVPFLVNFPGESRGLRYSAPFNTVLSRRLVTAIMQGKIQSAEEAAAWIDHNVMSAGL